MKKNNSLTKYLRVCLLLLTLLYLTVPVFAQTDAEFQQQMNDYKQKLQKVKTGPEGIKLLNEMMAKQKAYLNKKTDTVRKIKAKYGTDQAVSAITGIYNSDKGYDDNPLYTKVKVEVSFSLHENSSSSSREGNSTFTAEESGKIVMTTYLFKYLNRIVLSTPGDAIKELAVSGSYDVNSLDHSNNGGESHNYTIMADAVSTPLPGVSLSYEGPDHWSAGCGLNYKGNFHDEQGSRADNPSESVDAANDNGKLTMQGNVITITRNISENTTTKIQDDGTQRIGKSGTLTITISPAPPDKYVAYLTPVMGNDAFSKWLPEGYNPVTEAHGNYVDVKIKLVKASSPGQDLNSMIKFIKWELPNEDVSRVPGYANNGPSETIEQHEHPTDHDPISWVADMQLHLTTEQPDTSVEHLTDTSNVTNDYTIRVYCFDYGAFAKLTAHVVLADGTEIIAKDQTTDHSFLLLPKRTPNSRIATCYKQQYNVMDKADDADDEKIIADDKYPGDGFTLYEEYRGWMEDRVHFRGDPNAKDVMILDDINTGRSKDGIAMYQSALNERKPNAVITHHDFKEDEFGLQRSQATASEIRSATEFGNSIIPRDKWLNFNFLPDVHEVDQYGICMVYSPKHLGFAVACPKDDSKHFLGTPKDNDFLVISASLNPDTSGYAEVMADITWKGDINTSRIGDSKIITDEYAVTIAHEMLHYSGVNHHGNYSYNGGRKTTFVPQPNGLWTINGDTDYFLAYESNPTNYLRSDAPRVKAFSVMLRGQQGTCSGNEDCLMRYDDSHGYASQKLKIVYLTDVSMYGELTGMHLCTSKKGTGVNAATHKPESRYGDAANGDCLHQYCINDKYADIKLTGL